MPTAFHIFLESKAFGISNAGHLYLVLCEVICRCGSRAGSSGDGVRK